MEDDFEAAQTRCWEAEKKFSIAIGQKLCIHQIVSQRSVWMKKMKTLSEAASLGPKGQLNGRAREHLQMLEEESCRQLSPD